MKLTCTLQTALHLPVLSSHFFERSMHCWDGFEAVVAVWPNVTGSDVVEAESAWSRITTSATT